MCFGARFLFYTDIYTVRRTVFFFFLQTALVGLYYSSLMTPFLISFPRTVSDSVTLATKWMMVQTDVMMKMPTILQPSLVKSSFLSTDSAPAMSLMAMTMNISIAMKSIPAISGLTMCTSRLLAISFDDMASTII